MKIADDRFVESQRISQEEIYRLHIQQQEMVNILQEQLHAAQQQHQVHPSGVNNL